MKRFLVALIMSMMLTTNVDAGEVETIGRGVNEQAAIRNGLRQAIEQEIGVLIDSKTITSNYKIINDEVYAKSSGFIAGYEIISSTMINGICEVKLRADVLSDALKTTLMTRLQKKTMIETTMDDPRILVVAVDESGNELIDVENEFIVALQSQGFGRLISSNQPFGSKRALDVIETSSADYVAQIVYSERSITARLIGTSTGEVLCAETFEIKRRLFTDTHGWALRNAARLLAQSALESASQLEQHVTIVIASSTLEQIGGFNQIDARLEKISGINGVFSRKLIDGRAEVDVNFDGTAADLVAELERVGFKIHEFDSKMIKI